MKRGTPLVLGLAALLAAASAFAWGKRVARPKDLPANVPKDAVITRWSNQGEGGLLEISWGSSSMLWAEPCRSRKAAASFASGEERRLDCPARIDMKVRPLMLGTLDEAATSKARGGGASDACCYGFQTLGNR